MNSRAIDYALINLIIILQPLVQCYILLAFGMIIDIADAVPLAVERLLPQRHLDVSDATAVGCVTLLSDDETASTLPLTDQLTRHTGSRKSCKVILD